MPEENAIFQSEYLWTNMIVGEVFPTATTPSTWSVWGDYFSMLSMGDIPTIQRIGGRPYLNYSLTYSFLRKLMLTDERAMAMIKDSIGVPPLGVEIPRFPVSWKTILFKVLPQEARNQQKKNNLRKAIHAHLGLVRRQCQALQVRIAQGSAEELTGLWTGEIRPLWQAMHPLQDKMNEELNQASQRLKKDLTQSLGEEQANALLTTISGAGELASLGPLLGLVKVKQAKLSQEEYTRLYSHRGPHENELLEPRPYEDSGWLDNQMQALSKAPIAIDTLLEKRKAEFDAVLTKIAQQLPERKAQDIARRAAALVETNNLREETRSELTRVVSLIRSFFLRAGELTSLEVGIFFLTIDEVIAVLSGDKSSVEHIPGRQALHERHRALPDLPAWIRGPFDPFQWAADPDRREDVYDPHVAQLPLAPRIGTLLKGKPGSAGIIEGTIQKIENPEEGDNLQTGEILLARTTNVGWTPLFPRAAAVITDIGGSLSHAAIVARELGIPAVVGCGDATRRLKNGDRVRVDGKKGIVEVLEKA